MKSPHKEKRTWLKFGDTLSDTLHDARSFMAQHHREDSLGVRAAQCVGVSVTNPCGHNLDADFSSFRRSHLYLLYHKRFPSLPCYCRLTCDPLSDSCHVLTKPHVRLGNTAVFIIGLPNHRAKSCLCGLSKPTQLS